MTEKLLLEIIIVLIGVLIVMAAFIWRGHDKHHSDLEAKIDELSKQRITCSTSFASKESITRVFVRIDEQQQEIGELVERITRVETRPKAL